MKNIRRPRPARRTPLAVPTALAAILALTLVAVAASGCNGAHTRPDDALENPVDVLAALDARQDQVKSLRLVTRADYYDERKGKRVAGREVSIAAEAPGKLRVTLTAFGKALASLASDGTTFTMLDLDQQVYYHGAATAENLSLLIPLYLSGEDFVRVLLGGFPVDDLVADWRDEAELGWDSNDGRYALEIPRRGGGTQIVELTHPALHVAEIRRISEDGKTEYKYRAKEFESVDGIPVPGKSRFEVPAKDIEVTLFIETFETNVSLNARIWQISPPTGVDVQQVGPPVTEDSSAADDDF